jgi:hypothetical protein
MAENGPSPTHCIKSIEFSQSERGTWEVYQNNGVGHVYSSFYGDTVDIFLGPHKATWTGTATGYVADGAADDEVYNVYKKSAAIREKLGELTTEVNPAVLDHMYASRVLDYKRIDGEIKSDVQANNIWSKTYAKFGSTGLGGQIQSDTIANTVTTTTTAATITNVTTALLINNFNHAANNFNFTLGLQENIGVGAQLNLWLGPKLDVNLSQWGHFSLDWTGFHCVKTDATAAETRLTTLRTDIDNEINRATLAENAVALTVTNLDLQHQLLSLDVQILALEVELGA